MKITIRPALPSDAKALTRCIDAAYARYKNVIEDLPDVSSGLSEDIRSNVVFVAEQEAALVGGLVLVLNDQTALLANLAVDPKFGGQGIAGKLIDRAVTECTEKGLHQLLLSTHIKMPENVAFYKHLGWSVVSASGNKIQMERRL